MPNLTTATSHRTRATLQQVATLHSRSVALSPATRDVFTHIAAGNIVGIDFDPAYAEILEDAFFEAAVSLSTRFGQSYSRRCHGSDLHALRAAVLAGQDIAPREYHLNVVVKGATPAAVDTFERALRAFQHDGVTVESVEGV